MLLKYILQDDFGNHLARILALLQDLASQQTGLSYVETVLRYIAGGTDKVTATDLKRAVETIFAEGEDLMSTIAEQWVEQGREEGRTAALTILQCWLNHRFNISLDYFDEAFQTLDLAAITHLSDLAFEVETLADFERQLAEIKAEGDEQTAS